MPRWASRINLEITDIRVERLQEITPGDAVSEGIFWEVSLRLSDADYNKAVVDAFRNLWDSVNDKDPNKYKANPNAWYANPWVWVIEFKRVQGD